MNDPYEQHNSQEKKPEEEVKEQFACCAFACQKYLPSVFWNLVEERAILVLLNREIIPSACSKKKQSEFKSHFRGPEIHRGIL